MSPLLKLKDVQDQEIDLQLNDQDNFHIEYDIWDESIDITEVYADRISVYVLLTEKLLRDIEAEILTILKFNYAEDYLAAITY